MKRDGTVAKACLAILALGMTLASAACGETYANDGQGVVACVDNGPVGRSLCSYKVPIGETRYVTCVGYGGNGITCDWAHADGADKGWD